MKENIKKMVLGIFAFYCVTTVILMLFNYNNAVIEIELNDSESNIGKLNDYKKQVQLLEKDECTGVISEMINYYEQTSYDGKVNLKEMYDFNSENGGLRFFSKAKENCNISDDDIDKYNLPAKFISYVMPVEHLYQKYMFQYEISLKDALARNISETYLTNIDYTISQTTQLEIINNLIEIYSERMVESE